LLWLQHTAASTATRPGVEAAAGIFGSVGFASLGWRFGAVARVQALRKARLVALPPASRVRGLLRFVFSQRTCDLVFDPVVADVQQEWIEAVAAGRKWHAAWVRVRGYLTLLQHAMAQLPMSFGRAMYEMWKASKL